MPVALIISSGYDPEYLRIIEQIARNCSDSELIPVVFDIAPVMDSPTESHSPTLLRLGRFDSQPDYAKRRFDELSITLLNAAQFEHRVEEMPSEARATLEEATQSALLTYFRTDILNLSNRRVLKVRQSLLREGARSYWAMKQYLKDTSPAIAYVPNGRFPAQRMAKVALAELGVPVWHFEKGATRDHAFFRPYSPHDRIATQADVDTVLKGKSKKLIEGVANTWLEARLPSATSSNEYAEIWAASNPNLTKTQTGQGRIGFFTSSQDEFLHLGPDWQLHSWISQTEAFDQLITYFESQGFSCFLRVHPNLSTKDHACFKRELNDLRRLAEKHPALDVYWHDDPTSSYSLMDGSKGIVVWDSTIGLEASAQSIPVWNCAASYYGLSADTRQVLGPEDMNDETLTPWAVDAYRAKRFIACSVLRDLPLETHAQDWATWDLTHPAFVVKVAALARSGGAPTVIDVYLSSIDPWRHRSFTVNRKLMTTKLKKLFGH